MNDTDVCVNLLYSIRYIHRRRSYPNVLCADISEKGNEQQCPSGLWFRQDGCGGGGDDSSAECENNDTVGGRSYLYIYIGTTDILCVGTFVLFVRRR